MNTTTNKEPTMTTQKSERMFWSFETDINKATETANTLRSQGRSTRIYARTVRAEGMVIYGWAIVTDFPGFPGGSQLAVNSRSGA